METEIHKLRIFRREGKNFRMARRLEAILRAPKFRNILRVSPARRGFNGARSSGNKLEFLRTSKSRLAPPPPCIRDRYASAASGRTFIPISFYYRLRIALYIAVASRNEPRREIPTEGRSEQRRDEDHLLKFRTLSALLILCRK